MVSVSTRHQLEIQFRASLVQHHQKLNEVTNYPLFIKQADIGAAETAFCDPTLADSRE